MTTQQLVYWMQHLEWKNALPPAGKLRLARLGPNPPAGQVVSDCAVQELAEWFEAAGEPILWRDSPDA